MASTNDTHQENSFASQFETALLKGTLVKRYKRFFAEVILANGEVITAHNPNTGKMTGCAEPGFTAWVQPNNNPKRKLKFTLELVQNKSEEWIGVNTQRANSIVSDALKLGLINEIDDIASITPEVKYGAENSKIDFLITHNDGAQTYLEVKSVTLKDPQSSRGYFPDTVSTRAHKHCRELTVLKQTTEARAMMLYLVQHSGIKSVTPATHIDPKYTESVKHALNKGVEFIAYDCKIDEENIVINQPLKFIE